MCPPARASMSSSLTEPTPAPWCVRVTSAGERGSPLLEAAAAALPSCAERCGGFVCDYVSNRFATGRKRTSDVGGYVHLSWRGVNTRPLPPLGLVGAYMVAVAGAHAHPSSVWGHKDPSQQVHRLASERAVRHAPTCRRSREGSSRGCAGCGASAVTVVGWRS